MGAVLHREQQDAWKKEGSLDPEQSLKALLEISAQKKADAGSGTRVSGANSETPSNGCSECGGARCHPEYCFENVELAALTGMAGSIH